MPEKDTYEVEVLAPEFEAGKPSGESEGDWATKLATRRQILTYLKNAEHYEVEEVEEPD